MPEGRGMADSLSDAPAAGLPGFLCLLFVPCIRIPAETSFQILPCLEKSFPRRPCI